jgi:hypothetical protein
MKHIIIILSSALLLTSCSKVPKCWECTRTITRQNNTSAPKVTTTTHQLCDNTRKEMEYYEKVNTTYVATANTVSVVTECH